MAALQTHILFTDEDLAESVNTIEKAEREVGPTPRFPLGRRWTTHPSRFALSDSDKERYRKREICLSLLHGRIG